MKAMGRACSALISIVALTANAAAREPWLNQPSDGWGKTLQTAAPWLSASRDYVAVIAFPPKNPLDMRTADRLRGSMEYDGFSGDIGHMSVAWQCHDLEGTVHRYVTGHSGEHVGQTKTMIKTGWGLTPFFSTFTDGIFEEPVHFDDVRIASYSDLDNNKSFIPVFFEVTRQQCSAFVRFYHDFRTIGASPGAPPAYKNFGIPVQPEKFEGGGCGSFAMAALKKAGVADTVLPLFARTLRASPRLLGFRQSYPIYTTPYYPPGFSYRSVSLKNFMRSSWNDETGIGPQLTMIDSELYLYFVRVLQEVHAKANPNTRMPTLKRVASRYDPGTEISLDGSFANEWVTSEEIGRDFDIQTNMVYTAATEWWNGLQSLGYRTRELVMASRWGLLLQMR